MIRSTKHTLKDLNGGKSNMLRLFCAEYSRVCKLVIDEIWDNGYVVADDMRAKGWTDFNSDDKQMLSLPNKLDYKKFNIETSLSARAFQCCVNQAGGIIRASVTKQRKVEFYRQKHANYKGKDNKFSKPVLEQDVSPQLNANCLNIQKCKSGRFWGFIELKSLGEQFGKIRVPILGHKQFNKWLNRGMDICNSVSIFKKSLQLSLERDIEPHPQGDKVIGIDQGLKTVATLSDGQTTPDVDAHGHSLDAILDKLSRKTKDSNAFGRAQKHRKNFINWCINQLNFDGLKEVRLEKIVNIGYKSGRSRKLSHWTNTEIRDKITSLCESLEVPIVLQDSTYRSQRCHSCGNVRKANRSGKTYSCKNCGTVCDADHNAAMNHEADLPNIPFGLRGRKLNIGKGFFWNPDGIKTFDGQELIVPAY